MDNNARVKKALRDVLGVSPNYPVRGVVKKISGQTCTVELNSGQLIDDIKLKAINDDAEDYFLTTPRLDSSVLMISDDGSLDSLTIIQIDQVERFEFAQSGLKILFDSRDQKVAISNQKTSLKKIMADLLDMLKTLKVYTNTGPSGTALPDSLTKIKGIEQAINKLLK